MNVLIDLTDSVLSELNSRARRLNVPRRTLINHAIIRFLTQTTVENNAEMIQEQRREQTKDKALNQLVKEIL